MAGYPELLAPVGSWEAMVAAIQNGADAIYLGGKLFSARAYANNFDLEELEKAVDYAHVRGAKVYVTVNTLLLNEELPEALNFIKSLYEIGVNAIIIQDLGAAKMIKQLLPGMEIHASTQMTIHNLEAVQLLYKFGFQRIVLAREVSLEDIKYIDSQTPVELEVFIHGALCVCYSGACLMSSLIGGRSGNRGRCAQPCRLKYSLVNMAGQELAGGEEGQHLLSPRDLNMIENIPELMEAGIESLKIEGRMKRPEYVATVIRCYRDAIDSYFKDKDSYRVVPEHQKDLKQIFNRDFTTGYFYGFQGKDMMSFNRPNNRGLRLGRIADYDYYKKEAEILLEEGLHVGDGIEIWVSKGGRKGLVVSTMKVEGKSVESALPGTTVTIPVAAAIHTGDRVFKTNDALLMTKASQSYKSSKELRKIPLKFEVEATLGEPLKVRVTDPIGNFGEGKTNFLAEKAMKRALNEEVLQGQLNRLGNTPYELETLICNIEEDLMVPLGEINEARRLAIAVLEATKAQQQKPQKVDDGAFKAKLKELNSFAKVSEASRDSVSLNVLVGSLAAVKKAVDSGADTIYFGGDNFKRGTTFGADDVLMALDYCRNKGKRIFLSTPRILQRAEMENYKAFLNKLPLQEFDGILMANMGLFEVLKEDYSKELLADYPLNIFNRQTGEFYKDLGCSRLTLSPELSLEQLRTFGSPLSKEYLVHGQLTMMVSEYCGLGTVLSGITGKEKCPRPCQKDNYGLRDRLKLVFPLEVDQYCHMHVFNPKELCLIEDIPELLAVGINNLRLELKRDEPEKVAKIVKTYKQAIREYLSKPKAYSGEEFRQELEKSSPNGITKGHLYRGVI